MMKRTVLLSSFALLVAGAWHGTVAQGIPRDFGFGKMEIYKINKGTRRLLCEDIDKDGLDDITFLNNTKSRLEILFRKKKIVGKSDALLDDLFENKGMMLDQQVSFYRLVDLNNDKKTDVLTLGSPLGLYIRYQEKKREFSAPEHLFLNDVQNIMTVQVGDINEDGLQDIVVSRRNGAEILWNDAKHTFLKRKKVPYTDDKCYWLELVDADSDGHLDLLQYYNSNKIPLKVRRGDGKGEFGASNLLRCPRMRSITLIKPRHNQPLMISGILNNALGLRLYGFDKKEQPELLNTQEFTPQKLAVPEKGSVTRLPWISHDFNRDGYDDLLVSAPGLSRLYLYDGNADGVEATPRKIDTLSEVCGLNLLADGDVLAVSKKEKAVAIHHRKSFDKFPEMLSIKGELIAATAITGTKSIFVIHRSDDKLFLDQYDGKELKKSDELELDNDPASIKAFALEKGQTGIILFMDYGTPEMLLVDKDGLKKVKSEKFRALAQPLKPFQVVEPQVGSGKSLVVAQGATVRRYSWKNGTYQITRQYTPNNEHAEVFLACSYTHAKKKGLMVYDQKSRNLLWYGNDKKSAPKKIHLAGEDGGFEGMVQLKNKKRSVLMMVGAKDMAMLVDNSQVLELKELGEYMSASEKPSLRFSRAIEVSKPNRPALAIVDANNRSIEIASRTDDDGIKHELTFAVFLRSDMVGPVVSRTTEPHDIASGDINGDGYADMILLVHDKLIIYPGE